MATFVKWFGAQVGEFIRNEVETIVKSGCYDIENDAKRSATAYVKTGRERASISVNWSGSGLTYGKIKSPVKGTKHSDGVLEPKAQVGEFVGAVGTNVEYARRLELGFVGTDSLGRNYNQKPRPHLIPAYERNRLKILAKFGGKLPWKGLYVFLWLF